jgi:hypothetical protein
MKDDIERTYIKRKPKTDKEKIDEAFEATKKKMSTPEMMAILKRLAKK